MNYQNNAEILNQIVQDFTHLETLITKEFSQEAKKVYKYRQHIEKDAFRILVLGEFKRGKSTLLNALLGHDVLPRKIAPCTAVITILQYAETPQVIVEFEEGDKETLSLDKFKQVYELKAKDSAERTEDRFSKVQQATIQYPFELAKNRVEFIDSPGLGEHIVRTKRTQNYLNQVDAIIFVLDATQLLTQEEVDFLENVLLPMGLNNIFFVINRWNILESSVLHNEELPQELQQIEQRIDSLRKFCIFNHIDKSSERIFRINALGALQARLKKDAKALEKTNVPFLEKALANFLLTERFKIRIERIEAISADIYKNIEKNIQTKLHLSNQSVEELQKIQTRLLPKFDQLRAIRDHIQNYLPEQENILNHKLQKSFEKKINEIIDNFDKNLPKLGLNEAIQGSILLKQVSSWFDKEKQGFLKELEEKIRPHLVQFLEKELQDWNHNQATIIMQENLQDIERIISAEVMLYQEVLESINSILGIDIKKVDKNELLREWLEQDFAFTNFSNKNKHFSLRLAFDLTPLLGGLAIDMVFSLGGVFLPLIGLAATSYFLYKREGHMRNELQDKILKGIYEKLEEYKQTNLALFSQHIHKIFTGFSENILVKIDEQISVIEGNIESIITKKQQADYSYQQEQKQLESLLQQSNTILEKIKSRLKNVDTKQEFLSPAPKLLSIKLKQNDTTIFADKLEQIQRIVETWQQLAEKIVSRLSYAEPEYQSLSENLNTAYQSLKKALSEPELVLATAGTTSGGKSSIVNLLCGAELMPVAVGEMSAGIVSIYHSGFIRLVVHETPNASWETGQWENITNDAIHSRLKTIMQQYNKVREETNAPAPPQISLYYPTRIATLLPKFGLPTYTRCRILDLPGLKYISDKTSADLIQNATKQALSLVTYNSAETDSHKQKHLLQQIIQQIKELGSSPVRMLFILNKIDVFRKDKDWQESEKAFVETITYNIQKAIEQHLPEYAHLINKLAIIKLSSEAALQGYFLEHGDKEYKLAASHFIDAHYRYLLSNKAKRFIQRQPRWVWFWNRKKFINTGAELWHSAHADNFETVLAQHLKTHFPDIILPPVINAFKDQAANKAFEWALQISQAQLNSSEALYQQECENIKNITTQLQNLLDNQAQEVIKPLKAMEAALPQDLGMDYNEIIFELSKKLFDNIQLIEKTTPFDQLPAGTLAPLYSWQQILLNDAIYPVLQATISCLLQGSIHALDKIQDLVLPHQLQQYRENIEAFIEAGYITDIAEQGIEVKTINEETKENILYLQECFRDLRNALKIILTETLQRTIQREKQRIITAVQNLMTCYSDNIAQQAEKIAPHLGLSLQPVDITKINIENLALHLTFNTDLTIQEESIEVPEGYKEVEQERSWYHPLRWVGQKSKIEQQTEYVEKTQLSIQVPKAEQLFLDWETQAKQQMPEILVAFSLWLIEQIQAVNNNIDHYHQYLLENYQAKLDQAYQHAIEVHQQDSSFWQDIYQQTNNLTQQIYENLNTTIRK